MGRIRALLAGGLLVAAMAAPPAASASPGDCSTMLYGWNFVQLASGAWSEGTHTVSFLYQGAELAAGAFDVDASAPLYKGQVSIILMAPAPYYVLLLGVDGPVGVDLAGRQVINPAQRTDLMDLWWFPFARAEVAPFWNSDATRESVSIDGADAVVLHHSSLVSACMGGMGWTREPVGHPASGAFHRSFGQGHGG